MIYRYEELKNNTKFFSESIVFGEVKEFIERVQKEALESLTVYEKIDKIVHNIPKNNRTFIGVLSNMLTDYGFKHEIKQIIEDDGWKRRAVVIIEWNLSLDENVKN